MVISALDIIGSRDIDCEKDVDEALSLSGANLAGLFLPDADFRGFDLFDTDLRSAFMDGSDLSHPDFGAIHDLAAKLSNARLTCANLSNITLSSDQLGDLYSANIYGANVHGVEPDAIRMSLLTIGAVDKLPADWMAASRSCRSIMWLPPSKRVFRSVAGCAADNRLGR
jgi:uncharacterized protein YjbI with pentapeptide repeats